MAGRARSPSAPPESQHQPRTSSTAGPGWQRTAARQPHPPAKKVVTASALTKLAVLPLVMEERPSYAAAVMRKTRLHKHNLKFVQLHCSMNLDAGRVARLVQKEEL
jgi:hypothetical protein